MDLVGQSNQLFVPIDILSLYCFIQHVQYPVVIGPGYHQTLNTLFTYAYCSESSLTLFLLSWNGSESESEKSVSSGFLLLSPITDFKPPPTAGIYVQVSEPLIPIMPKWAMATKRIHRVVYSSILSWAVTTVSVSVRIVRREVMQTSLSRTVAWARQR